MVAKQIQTKRVRKNRKREIRSDYRQLRSEVEHKLATAVDSPITVRVTSEYRLVTFILMKKLERKGYRCTLEINKIDWFRGRCEDILDIYFD